MKTSSPKVSKLIYLFTIFLFSTAAVVDSKELGRNSGFLSGSHLNWGLLNEWIVDPAPIPPAALTTVLANAKKQLSLQVEPVEALYLEGTLDSDPRHKASHDAISSFPAIFDLAVCVRVEPRGTDLSRQCLQTVSAALTSWAKTYRPDGNPINDARFEPILQAIDLVAPVADLKMSRLWIDWVRSFAAAGDAYRARQEDHRARQALRGEPDTDTWNFNNNHTAARLLIRAMVAMMSDDEALKTSTASLLSDFVKNRNFIKNDLGIQDGRTFDFIQRDALFYHIADLNWLLRSYLYAPSLVDPGARTLIEQGINFTKPFYQGKQQHVEWLHSTISTDAARCKDGTVQFCPAPFKPTSEQSLLRLARPAFPGIQSWTSDVLTGHYDRDTTFLAAIYGEPALAGD